MRKLAGPMYNNSINAGIASYNNKDYKTALASFTSSQEYAKLIGLTDSTGIYYGAVSAGKVENYEAAIANYKKCIEIGFNGFVFQYPNINSALKNLIKYFDKPT